MNEISREGERIIFNASNHQPHQRHRQTEFVKVSSNGNSIVRSGVQSLCLDFCFQSAIRHRIIMLLSLFVSLLLLLLLLNDL